MTEAAPTEALAVVEPEYIDDQDPSAGPGWQIVNLPSAEWALGRVADLEREVEENQESAASLIARIEMKLEHLNERAMRGVRFFRGKLEEYAKANRAALLGGGKAKSRKLIGGSIAWRSKGGGLKVEDQEALLAWAQNQPVELGLVRIKEEPAWDAIKAYATEKNLVPPGVVEMPAEEVIRVEVNAVGILRSPNHGNS